MPNVSYNTAAKEAIIAFFSSNPDRQFSADCIFRELSALMSKTPGKSTVYRLLSRLSDEGFLQKYRDGNAGSVLFSLVRRGDCSSHLHMKCTICGRVFHLECPQTCELLSHLQENHGFHINSDISLLYGQCSDCGRK